MWAIPGSPIISGSATRFKALEMEKEVNRISKPANIGRVVGALNRIQLILNPVKNN